MATGPHSYNLAALTYIKSLEPGEKLSKKDNDSVLAGFKAAKVAYQDLRDSFPEVPQYRAELALVISTLGRFEGGKDGADKLEEARGLYKQLSERYPRMTEYTMRYAETCRNLSIALSRIADSLTDSTARSKLLTRAEALGREDVGTLESLAKGDSDTPESLTVSIGQAYRNLAATLSVQDKHDEARSAAEKAINCHEVALKLSPESPNYHSFLNRDLYTKSTVLLRLGDVDGAAMVAEELPKVVLPNQFTNYRKTVERLKQCGDASKGRGPEFETRAVHVLRKAVADKVIQAPQQLGLPEFLHLQHRDDFQRLKESLKPPVAG